MTLPPAITIHSLIQARRALAPGKPVTLLSAEGAASYAGCAWWRAVICASGTTFPDLLDCADSPGRALEALSIGCRGLILWPCNAWPDIAERAELMGATLLSAPPASLDLGTPGAHRRVEAWLGIG